MMARLVKVLRVAAFSAVTLALAGPAQADEASFLDAAGPMPGPISQAGIVQMGHDICSELRINPATENLAPRVVGRAFWIYSYFTPQAISAAQHELCPDTLEANPATPTPEPADPSAPPGV